MILLSGADLLVLARRVVGPGYVVADQGLLESAAARAAAAFDGVDVYPGLLHKAAALTHSLVCHHALVDGNMRLALAALVVFLGMNGARLSASNDEAYDLIMAIADGTLRDVAELRDRIAGLTEASP